MKNILIIIPSLKLGGGAEKVAAKIGSEFYNKGYNTKYFTFYNAEKKYDFSGEEYCLNEKLNGNVISKILKLFTRAYKIKKFCKKEKIDTIFSFMEDSNFPVIASKVFGNKAKINVSIRHSISDYGKGIYYWLIKLLYRYADNLIVLTSYERNNLIKTFNIKEKKIKVIPNAVDIEKIDKSKYQSLGEYENLFTENKFTFITVGRLHRIKNQELIIKCFNKLNEKYSNIQLIILGDGELRKYLEEIANNNVYFLGNQENPYKFLNKCNCFLLSSFSESFSNVIIEAMSCQLPIISTESQGPNEILDNGKYGIITKNNDEKEFYEAIENILINEDVYRKYIGCSIKRVNHYLIKSIMKERIALL